MIYPCIDLQNGEVVQLVRGERKGIEIAKNYLEMAGLFAKYDIEINVIDLDAAKERGSNMDYVKEIASMVRCRVGGGVRSAAKARELIGAGAKKVIVGTAAFNTDGLNREFLEELASEIGESKVILATDVKQGYIAVKGWEQRTRVDLLGIIRELDRYASEMQYTFVDKEGMMQGTNIDYIRQLRDATQLTLTAAGGISSLKEIEQLENIGVNAVIGMAFYTGKITIEDVARYNRVDFAKCKGLVPVVVRDSRTGDVLMQAYMNREALEKTIETGLATYWSRSRNKIWVKGAEKSGNVQVVKEIYTDCDLDAILLKVEQQGSGACHEKEADGRAKWSCFFRRLK